MYYRNSQAAVVVYDIQNYDSFQRAKSWVTTLKNQVNILSVFLFLSCSHCRKAASCAVSSIRDLMFLFFCLFKESANACHSLGRKQKWTIEMPQRGCVKRSLALCQRKQIDIYGNVGENTIERSRAIYDHWYAFSLYFHIILLDGCHVLRFTLPIYCFVKKLNLKCFDSSLSGQALIDNINDSDDRNGESGRGTGRICAETSESKSRKCC